MNDYTNLLKYFLPTFFYDTNQDSSCIYIEFIILSLLLLIFIQGLFYKRSIRLNRDSIVNEIMPSKINGISDIQEVYKSTKTWKDSYIDNIPGMMLIIGLLGTFWGLGYGIKEMANILVNNDQQQQQIFASLNDSLLVLGVNFKSSLWGIIFNMTSRIVFKNNSFEHRTIVIEKIKSKILDQSVQEKRNREVDLKIKQHIVTLLGAIDIKNKSIIEQNIKIANALINMEQASKDSSSSILGAIDNFNKTTMQFKEIINNFSSAFRGSINDFNIEMKSTIESTNSIVLEVKDFITESNATIQNSVNILEKGINSSLRDFSINVASTLTSISKELNSSTENINLSIKESFNKLNKASNENTKLISNSTKDLENNITVLSDKLNFALKDIKTIMSESNEKASLLNRVLITLKAQLDQFNSINEKQNKTLESTVQLAQELTKGITSIYMKIN